MWSVICDSILSSSLDESTKALYLVLSFWLVLMLTGFGAGVLFSFISRLFFTSTYSEKE
ncbi:hypothetical protein [Morganella sp. EGD-HP17]|uniref:hypothetical protein n=1 Tax=Morganella sp. EGD-HP17 TaxID=1435146 RepID=UPI0004196BF2|nr:hypothetical protein [Morganella sp. EGD-HP17]ETO41220.1 hypothetical protein X965_11270 [Morganella sp. EGD-HP17]